VSSARMKAANTPASVVAVPHYITFDTKTMREVALLSGNAVFLGPELITSQQRLCVQVTANPGPFQHMRGRAI